MTLPPDNPLRKSLKVIENSGKIAVTIIEDRLSLSRLEAAVFETVDLKAVLED